MKTQQEKQESLFRSIEAFADHEGLKEVKLVVDEACNLKVACRGPEEAKNE